MKLQCTFGLLDIQKGRKKLGKQIAKHGPVGVIVRGDLIGAWSGDDGESVEFELDVHSVEVVE